MGARRSRRVLQLPSDDLERLSFFDSEPPDAASDAEDAAARRPRGAHRADTNPSAVSATVLAERHLGVESSVDALQETPHIYDYGTARTSSFSWAVFGRVGVQLVQIGGTLVLGRIVAPSQFGIFAAAMFIVALGQVFNDLGIGPAVVARERLDHRFLRTAFWLNATIGFVLWLVTIGLAFPMSLWYGYDSLELVVPMLGLCFALSFSSVGFALLERRFRLRMAVTIEFVAIGLGQVAAIAVALVSPTVFAVALSPVVATIGMSVGVLLVGGWRPGWRPAMHRDDLREIRGFVSFVTFFNIVTFAARNSDDFFLGRHVSAGALGYYSRSYQLMLLPVTQITAGLARALRPTFAQLKRHRERLQQTHNLAEIAAIGIGIGAGVALYCTAPSAVPVLLGPRWTPIVVLLQIFAISLPTQMVAAVNGALYVATGNVRLLFASGLFNASLLVAAYVIVSSHGIKAVAITFVVYSYVTLPVAVLPICRRLGLHIAPVLWRVLLLLVPGAGLFALLQLVPDVLGWQAAGPARLLCQLALLVLAGGVGLLVVRAVGLARLKAFAQGGPLQDESRVMTA